MNDQRSCSGTCFCGAVEVRVTGAPAAMGYCHCRSCREWSAGPVNAFSLWPPDAVSVVRGEDRLLGYSKNPTSNRRWCSECGGNVLTEHPTWNVTDVYVAILDGFEFEPAVHVNYGEAVLRVRDGLPKFRDMPSEMGGSGVTLDE